MKIKTKSCYDKKIDNKQQLTRTADPLTVAKAGACVITIIPSVTKTAYVVAEYQTLKNTAQTRALLSKCLSEK